MKKDEFKNYLLLARKKGRPPCIYHRAVTGLKNSDSLGRVTETIKKQNIDGIEFDIHATSDGKIIVRHDFAIETDSGYKWIKELSFKKLRKNISESDCPTLEDIVEAIGKTDKIVDIEIKQSDIANRIISKYKETTIYKQFIFTTLYENIYKEIIESDPDIAWMYGYPRDRGKNLTNRWWAQIIVKPAVFLIKHSLPKKILEMMRVIPTDFFSFYNKVISKDLVENIHGKNKFAIGATISLNNDTGSEKSLEHMTRMLVNGIDLIKTDNPECYLTALKNSLL